MYKSIFLRDPMVDMLNQITNQLNMHYLDHSIEDCFEDEKSYNYKINLAGTHKKDIDVSIEQNNKNEDFLVVKSGKSKRTYFIKKDCDKDSISAKYENGILNVQINKKESAKPIKINID